MVTRRLAGSAGGFSSPVALYAHSSDDYRLDCIKMGCNDCICKPIDWIQLAVAANSSPAATSRDRSSFPTITNANEESVLTTQEIRDLVAFLRPL